VRGFPLTTQQKRDLIAFPDTLTDTDLLRGPRWTNPWLAPHEEDRWR